MNLTEADLAEVPCLGCKALAMPKEEGVTVAHIGLWGFIQAVVMMGVHPPSVGVHLAKLCNAHQSIVAGLLADTANKNALSMEQLIAFLGPLIGVPVAARGSSLHDSDALFREVDQMMHDLWTKSVGLSGYEKQAWQRLAAGIEALARRAK